MDNAAATCVDVTAPRSRRGARAAALSITSGHAHGGVCQGDDRASGEVEAWRESAHETRGLAQAQREEGRRKVQPRGAALACLPVAGSCSRPRVLCGDICPVRDALITPLSSRQSCFAAQAVVDLTDDTTAGASSRCPLLFARTRCRRRRRRRCRRCRRPARPCDMAVATVLRLCARAARQWHPWPLRLAHRHRPQRRQHRRRRHPRRG